MRQPLKKGLSLIELLVTLVIVSILASIAYPAYTHHLQRVYRGKAEITLHQLALDMERYYLEHDTYVGAMLNALPARQDDPHYRYRIAAATRDTYRLTATPTSSDKNAEVLSIDEKGVPVTLRLAALVVTQT